MPDAPTSCVRLRRKFRYAAIRRGHSRFRVPLRAVHGRPSSDARRAPAVYALLRTAKLWRLRQDRGDRRWARREAWEKFELQHWKGPPKLASPSRSVHVREAAQVSSFLPRPTPPDRRGRRTLL